MLAIFMKAPENIPNVH